MSLKIIPGKPFTPMQPKLHKIPFNDLNYGFQVKWDGVRIITHFYDNKIKLFNRKLNERTLNYPKIVNALKETLPPNNIILDGEIVCIMQGKSNFQKIIKRDLSTDIKTIKNLTKVFPATYIVFDIIFLEKPLINLSFIERDKLLKEILPVTDILLPTDTFITKGIELFNTVNSNNLEGIVAKKLSGTYKEGKKHNDWLKIKVIQKAECIIGGFISQNKTIRSLLIGFISSDNKTLIYAGKVSSGLSSKERIILFDKLSKIETNVNYFNQEIIKSENITWVKPEYSVNVEYLEKTEQNLLRHPIITKINL